MDLFYSRVKAEALEPKPNKNDAAGQHKVFLFYVIV
jgi:hypothetical protein